MYSAKTGGYIWQNYGIYWSIEYIKHKLMDVLGKIKGYIRQKIMGYTVRYICQKLWDILDKTKGYFG